MFSLKEFGSDEYYFLFFWYKPNLFLILAEVAK